MRQEAAKLRATPFRSLNAAGKVRRLRVIAPFAVLAYTLIGKRTILDGLGGIRYAFERAPLRTLEFLSCRIKTNTHSEGDGRLLRGVPQKCERWPTIGC